MNIHSRRIHSAFLLFLPLFFGYGCQTHASVTMTGTRIIYDSTAKSADVQLKNNDNFPYIVTSWFDSGNIHDAPEKGRDIPFVVTPPVSRIQPNSGQVLTENLFSGLTLCKSLRLMLCKVITQKSKIKYW